MADLLRKRRSRDWEVTPGHFRAATLIVLGLVVAAGGVGWAVGRGWVGSEPTSPGSAAGERGLVDLLARVDARSVSADGVDNLTFPDTLTGVSGDPPVPGEPAATQAPSSVLVGDAGKMPFDLVVSVPQDDAAVILQQHLAAGWVGRLVAENGETTLVLEAGPDLEHARRALSKWQSEIPAGSSGVVGRLRLRDR